jgi:hypothetical protein
MLAVDRAGTGAGIFFGRKSSNDFRKHIDFVSVSID